MISSGRNDDFHEFNVPSETVENGSPDAPKSELGRTKSSRKARPRASGAFKKYKPARTSDIERRKRAAKEQLRRTGRKASGCPKENFLKDIIYIYIYIYIYICVRVAGCWSRPPLPFGRM